MDHPMTLKGALASQSTMRSPISPWHGICPLVLPLSEKLVRWPSHSPQRRTMHGSGWTSLVGVADVPRTSCVKLPPARSAPWWREIGTLVGRIPATSAVLSGPAEAPLEQVDLAELQEW